MAQRMTTLFLLLFLSVSFLSSAQTLDGSPYTPGKDANIDLYMNSWKDSEPYLTHGTLKEQDILTQGDPLKPPRKGAVLKYVNRFTHATLPPNTATQPTELKKEQEILIILSGKGQIKTGRKQSDLYSGICLLIPSGTNYTMTNDGAEPLTMYLISEPTPDGFKPVKNIVVKDENAIPIGSTTGHWCHIVKNLFGKNDGLATLYSVLTVGQDPMTIGHPHSHNEGCEEAWTAIRGTSLAFLGKQIRPQPPGTSYMIPPDEKTPHCNINTSDEMVKLLYFSVRKDIE